LLAKLARARARGNGSKATVRKITQTEQSRRPIAVEQFILQDERDGYFSEAALAGRLNNKIAVVTGAANGIGQGCAAMFAREGAAVW
jgi:hypothetical protein